MYSIHVLTIVYISKS